MVLVPKILEQIVDVVAQVVNSLIDKVVDIPVRNRDRPLYGLSNCSCETGAVDPAFDVGWKKKVFVARWVSDSLSELSMLSARRD